VELLLELHEVISLAGAMEEVFLPWPADDNEQRALRWRMGGQLTTTAAALAVAAGGEGLLLSSAGEEGSKDKNLIPTYLNSIHV
jgi:hypothetical protein